MNLSDLREKIQNICKLNCFIFHYFMLTALSNAMSKYRAEAGGRMNKLTWYFREFQTWNYFQIENSLRFNMGFVMLSFFLNDNMLLNKLSILVLLTSLRSELLKCFILLILHLTLPSPVTAKSLLAGGDFISMSSQAVLLCNYRMCKMFK